VSHNSGIIVEGPRAGEYFSAGVALLIIDGKPYQHRTLVRFKDGQSISAWCPGDMSNIVALQRIVDGDAAAAIEARQSEGRRRHYAEQLQASRSSNG
jgi:hypothetical protein